MATEECRQCQCCNHTDSHEDEPRRFGVAPALAEPVEGAAAKTAHATAECNGQTGVEMEALTAVSIACLTVYDMLKAVDRFMTIEAIGLVEKTGGKSGDWRRDET